MTVNEMKKKVVEAIEMKAREGATLGTLGALGV